MTLRLPITLLSFLFAATAFSQLHTVTGNVTDNQGSPLEFVNIVVKGTPRGTMSDASGAFSIDVSPTDSIQFSMIGFRKTTIVAGNRKRVSVAMDGIEQRMAEMIVTGYSKQERRDLTGSVSSVKLNEDVSFQTVDQMLQGKAPGVYMTTSSGALGSANVLSIRGLSSIMGDNNPLYVIDGVPIYGTGRSDNSTDISGGGIAAISMGGMQTGGGTLEYNMDLKYSFEKNPLASLAPEDIESIEILKDAFATAIYGSRGANGVILITTKKGSRERSRVSVNYTLGIDQIIAKPDLLNGDDYSQVYSSYFRGENYPKLMIFGICTEY